MKLADAVMKFVRWAGIPLAQRSAGSRRALYVLGLSVCIGLICTGFGLLHAFHSMSEESFENSPLGGLKYLIAIFGHMAVGGGVLGASIVLVHLVGTTSAFFTRVLFVAGMSWLYGWVIPEVLHTESLIPQFWIVLILFLMVGLLTARAITWLIFSAEGMDPELRRARWQLIPHWIIKLSAAKSGIPQATDTSGRGLSWTGVLVLLVAGSLALGLFSNAVVIDRAAQLIVFGVGLTFNIRVWRLVYHFGVLSSRKNRWAAIRLGLETVALNLLLECLLLTYPHVSLTGHALDALGPEINAGLLIVGTGSILGCAIAFALAVRSALGPNEKQLAMQWLLECEDSEAGGQANRESSLTWLRINKVSRVARLEKIVSRALEQIGRDGFERRPRPELAGVFGIGDSDAEVVKCALQGSDLLHAYLANRRAKTFLETVSAMEDMRHGRWHGHAQVLVKMRTLAKSNTNSYIRTLRLNTTGRLAELSEYDGRLEEAMCLLEESIRDADTLGLRHRLLIGYARVNLSIGRLLEAETALQESWSAHLELLEEQLEDGRVGYIPGAGATAVSTQHTNRTEEAEVLYARVGALVPLSKLGEQLMLEEAALLLLLERVKRAKAIGETKRNSASDRERLSDSRETLLLRRLKSFFALEGSVNGQIISKLEAMTLLGRWVPHTLVRARSGTLTIYEALSALSELAGVWWECGEISLLESADLNFKSLARDFFATHGARPSRRELRANIVRWIQDGDLEFRTKVFVASPNPVIAEWMLTGFGTRSLSGRWDLISIVRTVETQRALAYALLGALLARCGAPLASRESFAGALTIAEWGSDPDVKRAILHLKGASEEMVGLQEEALETYRAAIKLGDLSRRSVQTEEWKILFADQWQDLLRDAAELAALSGMGQECLEIVEQCKSQSLIDLIRSGKLEFSRVDKELIREHDRVVSALEHLEDLGIGQFQWNASASSEGSSGDIEWRESHESLLSTEADLWQRIKRQSSQYCTLSRAADVDWSVVDEVLCNINGVLASYFIGRRAVWVVLRKDSQVTVTRVAGVQVAPEQLLGMLESAISDLVRECEVSLGLRSEHLRFEKISGVLYELLIQPIAHELSETTTLVICPHGCLHNVPFEALYDRKARQYLLDKVATCYIPNAEVLQYWRRDTSDEEQANLLALGSPTTGDEIASLPFAEREVREIGQLFDDKTVLVGAEASEAVFKSEGHRFSVIHIAAHGKYVAASPLRSYLRLASGDGEDGNLHSYEVFATELRPGSLVCLSACESGQAGIRASDELIGLTRAFIYAGATGLVVSRWRVDDQASCIMMGELYRALRTQSLANALRQASQHVRSRNEQLSHPHHWASFAALGYVGMKKSPALAGSEN